MNERNQASPVSPNKVKSSASMETHIMKNRQRIPVSLPGQSDPVVLPPTLALAMGLIINAGREGISTPSLQSWGIYGVSNTMYRLRMHGIGIQTTRANMHDEDGNIRKGVGFYSFDGVLIPAPKAQAPASTSIKTLRSIVERIMSILKGII